MLFFRAGVLQLQTRVRHPTFKSGVLGPNVVSEIRYLPRAVGIVGATEHRLCSGERVPEIRLEK